MILGTAGHIDHGKTELIRALTGIETDRLREEKERGISIDIGFAWLDVAGTRVGVVDVPGHERFIRNMLAGAHGIDVVLLVVAADDGVMPQTEEHLDIVHLLGAQRGIVAMTKVDLVDGKRRDEVREEIEILVAGTALETAPVVEVSAISGEGLDDLRNALSDAVESFTQTPAAGLFRMPIDRSFVIHGHGTVVTGTATAGEVQAEQRLHVLPGSRAARVRGIQVHGTAVQHARRGQRIALNLGGVDAAEIERGQVVCDVSLDRVSDRVDAFVELRPAAGRPLQRHSLVRLHNGTAEAMAKIIYLDGREALAPKDRTYAQLALREPMAIFGGDRFILREQTGRATIGGGLVLYPFAAKPAKRVDPRLPVLERLHRAANLRDRLDALIALQSSPLVTSEELAAAANLRVGDVHSVLADHPSLRRFPDGGRPDAYATSAGWNDLSDRITGLLAAHHTQNPREAGLDIESLRSRVVAGVPPKVFRAVVADLEKSGAAVRQDNLLRLPQHEIRIDRKQAALAERVLEALEQASFTPPAPAALAVDLGVSVSDFDVCVEQLERENRAHRIEPKLVYSEAVLERVRELIRGHVAEHGEIDARALRDAIGASRKYSIALLTYFDRSGFTMRVGDTRKLRAR